MDATTTPSAQFLVEARLVRAATEWCGPHIDKVDKVADLHNTTMVFLAREQNFTPPHADRADAQNIAFVPADDSNLKICCCYAPFSGFRVQVVCI